MQIYWAKFQKSSSLLIHILEKTKGLVMMSMMMKHSTKIVKYVAPLHCMHVVCIINDWI